MAVTGSGHPALASTCPFVIALTYLRRNRVQAELAETYGVSQSTVSRAISVITPLLGKVLSEYVPAADDLGLTFGQATPAELAQWIRGHWQTGALHHVRDTVYREDHDQAWTGECPQALASLHNLAISLIRLKSKDGIKETTEWICRDRTRSLKFMATSCR
jgi:Helix-turn-helix of DDE superfamily endonuclease